MKRVLHISDLHFGRIHPPAIESLELFLTKQDKKIDLIVMTGDWTQRARASQYRAAADFIHRVKIPVITIPGNHDIPLFNFLMRWLAPLMSYNYFIKKITSDIYESPDLVIVGMPTAHPRRAVEGRIREACVQRARGVFSRAGEKTVKVIACHHPIVEPSGQTEVVPSSLVQEVLELKPDVILSGHSHINWVRQTASGQEGHSILHISAGSAISSRLRGEDNNFHILEFDSQRVQVKTYFLQPDGFILREEATSSANSHFNLN